MDIKKYLLALFDEDESLQHLDVMDGTNLHDLIIVPLSYLIEEKLSQDILDAEASKLDLGNYADFTVDDMLRIARNQFIDLVESSYTRGVIYLYFTSQVSYSALSGTKVYAGTKEFRFTYDVSFTESDYTEVGILYKSPPINIENSSGLSLDENAVSSIDGAPGELVKITHDAMTNGVAENTVSEIYSTIKGSMIYKAFLNHASAYRLLKERYPEIGRIQVVGAGDTEMLRDLLYNVTYPNDSIENDADFTGKIRGYITDTEEDGVKVYNSNSAYKIFLSSLGSGLSASAGIELSQQDYLNILEINNGYLQMTTSSILEEGFEQSSEVSGTIQTIASSALEDDKSLTLGAVTGLSAGQEIKIISYDGSGNTNRALINIIETVDTVTKIVTLYNKIGLDIVSTTTPSPYIEVLESVGINIGNGWIRGEDGMALTKTITNKEIMVLNNQLIMGTPDADFESHPIIDIIAQIGIGKFIDSINKSLTVNTYSAEQTVNDNTQGDTNV